MLPSLSKEDQPFSGTTSFMGPFALLILDMSISSLNSFDVLETLAGHINNRNLVVLALINAGDDRLQDRALCAGAQDVFTRPLTRAETLMRVDSVLSSLPGHGADGVVMRAVSRRFGAIL